MTFHEDQAVPIGAPDKLPPAKEMARHWLIVPIALALFIFWFFPVTGISETAWHLFLIFLATVIGIILRPFPMGAMAIMGLTTATATGVLPLQTALAGFSNGNIWLIVLACFISRALIKTGLATRMAYLFLSGFGYGPLGLGYGMMLSDLSLAPVVPSNTARVGGILVPVMRSLANVMDSRPEEGTAGRIGTFLALTMFHGSVISSTLFITAMAANPIIVQLAHDMGVEISWGLWFKAALVPGAVSLLVIPPIIYWLVPPTLKDVSVARTHAKEMLAGLGGMTSQEWLTLVAFALLLTLWVMGKSLGLDPTQAAFIGLAFLLLSNVLTWKDILAEELAWDILIWLSVLVTLAASLTSSGLVAWFTAHILYLIEGTHWAIALAVLSLVYFYSHYFFASITAHVTSMYAPFLAVALALGAPPLLSALLLAFASGLFGGLTHYGTGPAPVVFGLRYVSLKTWWAVGALLCTLYLIIWTLIGGIWWKWLEIW